MTASAIQPHSPAPLALAQPGDFTREQIDLIKRTVAAGTSDDELALFLEVCRSSGLNPFQKQIYAVMRKSRAQVGGRWEEQTKMVIQTGIDGYRLIASRSGAHLGTTDPEFGPTKDGYPEWARVIVRRLVHGHVAEFPATARWAEYVQAKDEYKNGSKTGNKTVTEMWARMPHTMLGKCAESLALRKAFPAELSGLYTADEMAQADSQEPQEAPSQPVGAQRPAPTSRRADVTREVAAQAGVEPQTTDQKEAALQAWASRIGDLAARIRARWPDAQVGFYFEKHRDYRTDLITAKELYAELSEFGKTLSAPPEPDGLSESETVDAEFTPAEPTPDGGMSDGQRKALCGHARRAGADTSEDRAALWGWALQEGGPRGTRTLTGEEAGRLLDWASANSDGQMVAALKVAKGGAA